MADPKRTVVPAQRTLVREGLAHPRGATWTGEGVNFTRSKGDYHQMPLMPVKHD
jgi:hypothetical protein